MVSLIRSGKRKVSKYMLAFYFVVFVKVMLWFLKRVFLRVGSMSNRSSMGTK